MIYAYAAVEGSPTSLPAGGMPAGSPPRALPLPDRVMLIVSEVPAATYAPEALEPRLSDIDWVAAAGAAHHAVVEAMADAGLVVLPVRLFTIFSSEEAARATMTGMRGPMRRAFDRVRGKQEWVLRIGKPDPARMHAAVPEPTSPASGTSFLKAKADQRRDTAMRAERTQSDAAACYDALALLAGESHRRPLEAGATLLLDAAFLVSPAQVERMKDALTDAAARLLADGCAVSLTGPWPPYSFASMDMSDDG